MVRGYFYLTVLMVLCQSIFPQKVENDGYYVADYMYEDYRYWETEREYFCLYFNTDTTVLFFDSTWIWGPYSTELSGEKIIFNDGSVEYRCKVEGTKLLMEEHCILDENVRWDWQDQCYQFATSDEIFTAELDFVEGEIPLPDTSRIYESYEAEEEIYIESNQPPYFSQFEEEDDPSIKKMLKADKVLYGIMGGDGMRMVRSKKTKKWGVYQVFGEEYSEFIPMTYDSLRSFDQNSFFTIVYNEGKVGVYLATWSFGDAAKESVPCIYDNYRIAEDIRSYPAVPYLAVEKDGKWAWIDWLENELKSEFSDELTIINYEQKLFQDN